MIGHSAHFAAKDIDGAATMVAESAFNEIINGVAIAVALV